MSRLIFVSSELISDVGNRLTCQFLQVLTPFSFVRHEIIDVHMEASTLEGLNDEKLLGDPPALLTLKGTLGKLLIKIFGYLEAQRRDSGLRATHRGDGAPVFSQLLAVGFDCEIFRFRSFDRF